MTQPYAQPTKSANEYASLALEVGGQRVPTVRDGTGADVAVLDIPSTGVTPYTIVIDLHKRPPSTSKQFNCLQVHVHMDGTISGIIGKPGACSLATPALQGQRLGFAPVQVAAGGSECATNVDQVGDIQVDIMLATQGTSTKALPPSTTLPSAAAKVAEGKKMFAVQTVSAGACTSAQVVGSKHSPVFARLRIKYARRMVLEMQGVLKPGAAVGGDRRQPGGNAGQPGAEQGWPPELSVLKGKRDRTNAAVKAEADGTIAGVPMVTTKRERVASGASRDMRPMPRGEPVKERKGAIAGGLGSDEKPALDLIRRAHDADEEVVFCGMRGNCSEQKSAKDDDVVLLDG